MKKFRNIFDNWWSNPENVLGIPNRKSLNIPWYSAGGIDPTHIAAYQAAKVASLAASYLKLGSATFGNASLDPAIVGGTAPGWNTDDGWLMDATLLTYLKTGILPDANWSYAFQFSNGRAADTYAFGSTGGAGKFVGPNTHWSDNKLYVGNGTEILGGNGIDVGNLIIAGNKLYINGVDQGVTIGAWNDGASTREIVIGAYNNSGVIAYHFTGDIQAFAAIDYQLTTEIPALAAAMADLTTPLTKDYFVSGSRFVVAGESNPSGRGTNNQVYSHATLKGGLFGNNYTWKKLIDPSDSSYGQLDTVSSDATAAGSIWPLVATSHATERNKPCAIIPCAKGGTAIADWLPGANHQDRTTLYGSMVYRALQTGCDLVILWIGANDAYGGTTQVDFQTRLAAFGDAVLADLNVPVMVFKLHHGNDYDDTAQNAINTAITNLIGTHNIVLGADLSDLTTTAADHFLTNLELSTVASRCWAAIKTQYGW